MRGRVRSSGYYSHHLHGLEGAGLRGDGSQALAILRLTQQLVGSTGAQPYYFRVSQGF